jgi:ElaA protein
MAFGIRRAVFIEEQGVPEHEEWDDLDGAARHYLLSVGEQVVGTARLLVGPDGTGKIGRVAVVRAVRGSGRGSFLMRFVIEDAARSGCGTLVLDAQVAVIPFYERLGFVAEGEVFMDAGIAHRRMRRLI